MKNFKNFTRYTKTLFLIVELFSILIFTACDFLQFQIGNETKKEEEPTDVYYYNKSDFSYDTLIELKEKPIEDENVKFENKTGRVFLLKYNPNFNDGTCSYVKASQTGWVENYIYQDKNTIKKSSSVQNVQDFSRNVTTIGQAEIPSIKEFEKARKFEEKPYAYLKNHSSRMVAKQTEQNQKKENQFWVFDKNSNPVLLEFEKKQTGDMCEIYYVSESDSNFDNFTIKNKTANGNLSDKNFKNLAEVFDNIYKKETELFSSTSDSSIKSSDDSPFIEAADSEPVKILVFDINQDSYTSQTSGTFGYFYGADLYKSSCLDKEKSNEGKILYIDDFFLKIYEKTVFSTIAHEYQHLLCFLNKIVRQNNKTLPTWYTEMLSMICEDYMIEDTENSRIGSLNPLYSRLRTFNDSYYLGFETWNSGNDVLSSYANAYTFGAFLVRNFNGTSLIKEIVSNSSAGKESVADAVNKILNKNFSFAEIFQKFSECLLITNIESKMYSLNKTFDNIYNSEINIYEDIGNGNSFPAIFSSYKKNGRVPLGIGSFSLHYVGSDILEINFSLPENPNVKFILLYEPN